MFNQSILKITDKIITIVKAGDTSKEIFKRVVTILRSLGDKKIAGFILNDVSKDNMNNSYYQYYQYQQYYNSNSNE